ncbi:N-(5'-phosphoribosyl)anthranilate isomerase [Moraxella macacae 0408225]|uniref:N-(5'-phosphoribosyl)anthranilate isomerase n=1 Tax=Moraxella macacae 0408225 TaxID=1230338 RepID=L2F4Q4_9GAMM|nr:phosphoribosylanthranilate isomerase [Moraxella macacae]ELA08014.1 N-(5'-phosphoribosyl)anthranilate isomerase [Moraxella macacae 0408225]
MKKLSVKFCGLTRVDDVKTAVNLGVDALGLVFVEQSPRYISLEQAALLSLEIPAFTTVVALVVNMPEQELVALSHQVRFDVVQFHGDESAHACHLMSQRICKRWIKAIRIKPDDTRSSILSQINELAKFGASGVILDTFNAQMFGGTGESFDWNKIPGNAPLPIYLAGGLTPDNIGQVIANQDLVEKIHGVDVSGGIEYKKGLKCEKKMAMFMDQLKFA